MGLLVLAFRGTNLQEIMQELAHTKTSLVALSLAMVFTTSLVKAARWLLLFHPRRLRYGKLLAILFIGQLVNIAVPARLGELVRALLVHEIEGESVAGGLSTIAVEKIIDTLALALMAVLVLPFMSLPTWVSEPMLVVGVVGIGGI